MFSFIGSIIIGAIAGTLATVLTGNDSSNMVKNIVISFFLEYPKKTRNFLRVSLQL